MGTLAAGKKCDGIRMNLTLSFYDFLISYLKQKELKSLTVGSYEILRHQSKR
jgi:hypothetical protein